MVSTTKEIGWPFVTAAALILIFGLGVVWYWAILVSILAGMKIVVRYH